MTLSSFGQNDPTPALPASGEGVRVLALRELESEWKTISRNSPPFARGLKGG